ncbi:MAG: hypothetical protein H0U74_21380 [Bradymonadaceae bacterium]|nr:hypothetical protein [Lujinxingiaceae bacterium]
MLIGYNNDVQYLGKTFHIQTEDRGSGNDQSIETQLFQGGQILDTKITSYVEHVVGLEGDDRTKKIKALMQGSHKSLYKKLMAGEYNALVGLAPVEGSHEADEADFTPGQDRVPDAARMVEEEGATAFPDQGMGDHVDLASLKSKLAGLSGGADDDDEELNEISDNEPATQVMDASALGATQPSLSSMSGTKPSTKTSSIPASLKAAAAAKVALPTPVKESVASLDFAPSGALAWKGCEAPAEDFALIKLVEAFLHV